MPGLTTNFLQKPLKSARNQSDLYYQQAIDQTKQGFGEAKGYQTPWNDFGQTALQDYQNWRADPNAVTSDPSYQWRFNQGQNAVENSAAAAGGALSGNAFRGIVDYGQNAASQEYGSEFARRMQELGIGQTAANNMSNLSTGESNALSNLLTGRGTNWWNTTLGTAQESRAAENDLNKLIQSWFPSGK
jgi:hypothetical protein